MKSEAKDLLVSNGDWVDLQRSVEILSLETSLFDLNLIQKQLLGLNTDSKDISLHSPQPQLKLDHCDKVQPLASLLPTLLIYLNKMMFFMRSENIRITNDLIMHTQKQSLYKILYRHKCANTSNNLNPDGNRTELASILNDLSSPKYDYENALVRTIDFLIKNHKSVKNLTSASGSNTKTRIDKDAITKLQRDQTNLIMSMAK